MIETLSVVIPSITYALYVLGSPSDLNTGNGTEGTMVCTSLGSLFPVFKSEGEPGTYSAYVMDGMTTDNVSII